MMTLKIADLTTSSELDREAMTAISGGTSEWFGGFSLLSPHIENNRQFNVLDQLNQQAVMNESGVVFNVPIQAADQYNSSDSFHGFGGLIA